MAILVSTGPRMPTGRSAENAAAQLPQRFEMLAETVHASLCQPLYKSGDAAEYWYQLLAGAACECVQTADGRRQIVDFLLPGDLFGFCSHERHEFSVELIVDGSTFARYPRRRAEQLASTDAELAEALRQKAFESISRLQARMVLLGRTNALEKVSAFLIEMADRTSKTRDDKLLLPMSRYDIADYLAMAVETVSRALTTLRARGAIKLSSSRLVQITNRQELEYLGTDLLDPHRLHTRECGPAPRTTPLRTQRSELLHIGAAEVYRPSEKSAAVGRSSPHPVNRSANPALPAAG